MLGFSLCLLLGQKPPCVLDVSELLLQSCLLFVQSLRKVTEEIRLTSSFVIFSTLNPRFLQLQFAYTPPFECWDSQTAEYFDMGDRTLGFSPEEALVATAEQPYRQAV